MSLGKSSPFIPLLILSVRKYVYLVACWGKSILVYVSKQLMGLVEWFEQFDQVREMLNS